ncbi:antileukoproteinase isoform X2 [Sarcophilus harrisii]|uniref:WAP domain-containing protein n=1 Tax=Sarcophilus harrisii TaxID=9305 RepID=G3WHP5_SARHA|nr:antileukoproteinase isoform X2 [Sarcophilus harrisii]
MKSGSLFFFVAFLAIGFLTVSGTLNAAKGAASKPGKCPIVHIRCAMENPPNACENDGECKGRLKCCTGACGKTCMAPEVVSKPGKCPTVLGRCMMENPPNACENDGECKGRLKCCTGMCGKICMAPKA